MSDLEAWWSGSFGNHYHARNRVNWRKRVQFWTEILELTGVRSVWEWGCGPGWNLTAIETADVPWSVEVYGTECNERAIDQAAYAGLEVWPGMPNPDEPLMFELSCTVGALIHVAPDDIRRQMKDIVDTSSDYVLAVEYEAQQETMVTYRGFENKLWNRPYGAMYEKMGLKLVAEGNAGDGFDDCHFWLLRK